MTAPRSTDQFIREFLAEGQTELPDPVYDAIRDRIEQTRQRAVIGSWGVPDMNKFVAIGLTAAAAVVIALIAFNLLPGSPAPGGEPTPSPLATPTASLTTASIAIGELPDHQVVLSLPAGWTPGEWFVQNSVVLLGLYPVTNVYGDPCHWQGSLPDPQVGPTVDDLATALVNQPTRDASVTSTTFDGFNGKQVTMSTPQDANFADCDLGIFGTWTEEGSDQPSRYSQGPGQLEEVYIVDVDGVRAVLDANYFPDRTTPADLADLQNIIATMDIQP